MDVLVTFFLIFVTDQNNRREERTKEARKEGGREDGGREREREGLLATWCGTSRRGITEAGGWSSSSHYSLTHLKPLYTITYSYFLFFLLQSEINKQLQQHLVLSQLWRQMPIIPAFGRQRENQEFQVIFDYINSFEISRPDYRRHYLKEKKKTEFWITCDGLTR